MRKTILVLLALVLIGCNGTPTPTESPIPTPTVVSPIPTPEEGLWFGVLIHQSLVDWFNQTATERDMASAKMNGVDMLDQITVGRRQVVFASVADAERIVPTLKGQIDIIGYNLEHWPETPDEEKDDPVAAVQRMRRLADEHDLKFILGPDRRFATEYGTEMVVYTDGFVIQLQKAQDTPKEALEYALPLIEDLRKVNFSLEISIVLRPDSTNIDRMLSLVDLFGNKIDGVSILTSSETIEAVVGFAEKLP